MRRTEEFEFYKKMEEKISKGTFRSKVVPFPVTELPAQFDEVVGRRGVNLEHD